MKHPVRLLVPVAIAALALAACGSSSKSSSASTTTQPAAPPTTIAVTTTTVATNATATVSSAQNATIGKAILVDSKGMTLYVWDNDTTKNSSTCDANSTCIQAWPPLYVTGTPTYGTGVNAAMFTTFMAPNGQMQLAVNGKPLYHWTADAKAGDAKGQGINKFYVVGVNGQKIDES